MADPYIGEIRLFAGFYQPSGWAFCDGQLLPIADHEALFGLLGTRYGGDGVTTFALPDMRGRAPVHVGSGYVLGEGGGVESVTLTEAQIPAHTHGMFASAAVADRHAPRDALLATMPSATVTAYGNDAPHVTSSAMVAPVGEARAHDNMQPYIALRFIIALAGIVPSS